MLPILSKILEKNVVISLLEYLQEKICYMNYNQPCVLVIPRKRHLSESPTKMLFKMDNNEVTGLVSVDSISVKLSTQSIII